MNTSSNLSLPALARAVRRGAAAALLGVASAWVSPVLSADLTVLTYHDVAADPGADHFALSRSMFVAHMDYLQRNGFQPISIAQLEEYSKNPQRMPTKPVMLTFDDGLKSYYEFVVPVLKTYQFPSVASIVTGWMDGKNLPPEYHNKLMKWEQVREISRLPLVEIVSHTHDLHHGIQSNPQGSLEAAAVTRQYFPQTQSYETEEDHSRRIYIDLQNSVQRFQAELGFSPRAVAWPYGQYDRMLSGYASELGLKYQFSLESGPTPLQRLPQINRIMLMQSTAIADLENELSYGWLATEQRRFSLINLDGFLQAGTVEQQELLLSEMLDRLEKLRLNMVVLPAFSSDQSKAFFHNGQIPVGTDVLRRIVHALRTKLAIRYIYVYLPAKPAAPDPAPVYTDLARLVRFDGVVFAAATDETSAAATRKLLTRFQPALKFGGFQLNNEAPQDSEFIIAMINPRAGIAYNRVRATHLKGTAVPVYLLSQEKYDINGFSPAALLEHFQALDVQHFGFHLDTQTLVSVLQPITAPETVRSGAGG